MKKINLVYLSFLMIFIWSCDAIADAAACVDKLNTVDTEQTEMAAAAFGVTGPNGENYDYATECDQLHTAVTDYIDSDCGTAEDLGYTEAEIDSMAVGKCI